MGKHSSGSGLYKGSGGPFFLFLALIVIGIFAYVLLESGIIK